MFKDTITKTVDHSGTISSHEVAVDLIAAQAGMEGVITQTVRPDGRAADGMLQVQARAARDAGREPDWDALYTSEDATIRSTYEVSFVTNWINDPAPGMKHAVAQVKLIFDKSTVQRLMNVLAAMLVEDVRQTRTVTIGTNYDGDLVRAYNDVPPTSTDHIVSWTVKQPRFVDLAEPGATDLDDDTDWYGGDNQSAIEAGRCSYCGDPDCHEDC